MKQKNLLGLTILLTLLCSCAGPTTPFGANINILITEQFEIDKDYHFNNQNPVSIQATPERQYYNSPYLLKLKIFDPQFDINKFRYEIVYNNRILKRWMKTETIKFPKKENEPIEIDFENLSILPGSINNIAFLYYPPGQKNPISYQLKIPQCIETKYNADLKISRFDIDEDLKNAIIELSNKYQKNPALMAALIAQESSFKPDALSYAKALGLTQITPLAHEDIRRYKKHWKIYPRFNRTPFLRLKTKLLTKEINPNNDWRLDPVKSIEGGLLYLKYLDEYWESKESQQVLAEIFRTEVPKTDIILASYNSGAFRVKKSLMRNKKKWLLDRNLNEAKKYVMNIKSYCHSFEPESTL